MIRYVLKLFLKVECGLSINFIPFLGFFTKKVKVCGDINHFDLYDNSGVLKKKKDSNILSLLIFI